MTTTYGLSLVVAAETEAEIAKATEVLSRTMLGLALDGLSASLTLTSDDDNEEDDDDADE